MATTTDYVTKLEQLEQRLRGMLSSHKRGDSLDAMAKLFGQIQQTRRQLLLERGEETVMPIAWSPLWDVCTPTPQVLSSGRRLFLLYHAHCITGENCPIVAVTEFKDYEAYRFSGFNGEMIENHPYRERGLEAYAAHIVVNSLWVRREQGINVVPPLHDDCSWDIYRHYFLTFPDNLFECLAKDHEVTIFPGDMEAAMRSIEARLAADARDELARNDA